MSGIRDYTLLRRASELELNVCILANRACRRKAVQKIFAIISRLGNGVFWYALTLLLPVLYGLDAIPVSLRMVGVGMVGLILYKLIKLFTERDRPYTASEKINLGTAPLDRYSFPSGHTLHAVGFTTVALWYYPELSIVLIPFTLLVAASRVILGLHYPTDVLAGALIGALTAAAGIILL